jgi:hypothetical protein
MFSLEAAQANVIATINQGPSALDPTLFDGPLERVLLGLKAHANTINHARLIALEESFPLTRKALGDDAFNRLSREFVENAEARACDNNAIGRPFPGFLRKSGAGPAICDLAAIEWAWLESYHAADAEALGLADIAGLDEARLLALPICAHPAARRTLLSAPLSDQLADLAALIHNPAAVLSVRPEAEVRLVPLDTATSSLFAEVKKTTTIGNLLALTAELPDITDASQPVMTLLGAGALMEAGHEGDPSQI